jgi:multidrug efflux pump subunit AcrA (membrane-fusion protein)
MPHESDSRIVAPKGYRQRDFEAGWRACERDVVEQGQRIAGLEDQRDQALALAEQATARAERFIAAIEQVSAALDGTAPVMRARLALAGLDLEAE